MSVREIIGGRSYPFDDRKTLLTKTGSGRSGNQLAGVAASSRGASVAAKMALTGVLLRGSLIEAMIP